MKVVFSVLVFLATVHSAFAWTIQESIDVITDEPRKQVAVTSADGHTFTLIRKSDNRVWAYVKLASPNQFMVGERLILRIDQDKPINFNEDLHNLMQRTGKPIKAWEWNPSLIGFLLWHGVAEKGCGLVKRLMESSKMVIRYHPNQSTERDIIFNTGQDRHLIGQSLNIDPSVCAATVSATPDLK